MVNFESKLLQHIRDINILMVTSQSGSEEGGAKMVHKQCVWGREQVTEQKSARMSECGRGRERETVVMIDARLPPLCSSEWLQQKAQNNIPTPLSAFLPPSLTRSPTLSLSLRLSWRTTSPLTDLQRLCWDWDGAGSTILGSHQQVRVGGPRPGIIARSSIIQLSRRHCSGKGKRN